MKTPNRKPVKFKMSYERQDGTVVEETTFAYDAVSATLYLLDKKRLVAMETGTIKTLLVEPA